MTAPDPDALAAFWRCLRETREAVNVRECKVQPWTYAYNWVRFREPIPEHTINVGYLREYRGDAFGRN